MAVVKADKAYRRRFFAIIFIFALALLPAAYWFSSALVEYACGKTFEEALRASQTIIQILFLSLIPCAVVLYRLGHRVLTSGVFPPPGQKVIRDTVIVEGKVARRKGYPLIAFSASILLISLSTAFIVTPYTFNKVLEDPRLKGTADITLESEFGPDCPDTLLRELWR